MKNILNKNSEIHAQNTACSVHNFTHSMVRQWHANLTDVSLNIASGSVAGRLSTHERVLQLRLGAARRRYAPDLTVHRRFGCFRGTQEI